MVRTERLIEDLWAADAVATANRGTTGVLHLGQAKGVATQTATESAVIGGGSAVRTLLPTALRQVLVNCGYGYQAA